MRRHRPQVVVFTRANCGLCRTAEARVATEARRARVDLIDVDRDDDLVRRYGLRVPVIMVDGIEVLEGNVRSGEVRAALRSARRQAGGFRHSGRHP